MDETLLQTEKLTLHFRTERGIVQAVDGMDFSPAIQPGSGDPRRIRLREKLPGQSHPAPVAQKCSHLFRKDHH